VGEQPKSERWKCLLKSAVAKKIRSIHRTSKEPAYRFFNFADVPFFQFRVGITTCIRSYPLTNVEYVRFGGATTSIIGKRFKISSQII
jgi:hypothetical protein